MYHVTGIEYLRIQDDFDFEKFPDWPGIEPLIHGVVLLNTRMFIALAWAKIQMWATHFQPILNIVW